MRKFTLTFAIFILTTALFGQKFKISFSPTINNVFHYRFVAGGPHGNPRFGINTHVDYLFVTGKKIEFGAEIGFQNSHVRLSYPLYETSGHVLAIEKVDLLSFGFRSNLKLKKYFYLCLVPTFDFQIKHNSLQHIDNQTGLGLSFGIGSSLELNESLSLNIEPRLWIHNIVPFQEENLPFRLTTFGLNLGLVFGQKKLE